MDSISSTYGEEVPAVGTKEPELKGGAVSENSENGETNKTVSTKKSKREYRKKTSTSSRSRSRSPKKESSTEDKGEVKQRRERVIIDEFGRERVVIESDSPKRGKGGRDNKHDRRDRDDRRDRGDRRDPRDRDDRRDPRDRDDRRNPRDRDDRNRDYIRDDRRDSRDRDDRRHPRDRDDRKVDRRDDGKVDRRDDAGRKRSRSRSSSPKRAPKNMYGSVPPPQYPPNQGGNQGYQPRMSLEDKKKLLWGSKKAESIVEVAPTIAPTPANSANEWENSKFNDDKRKEKFLQLMGAKKKKPEEAPVEYDPLAPTSPQRNAPVNTTGDANQDHLFSTLEQQFRSGVTRRHAGGTMGLGFN